MFNTPHAIRTTACMLFLLKCFLEKPPPLFAEIQLYLAAELFCVASAVTNTLVHKKQPSKMLEYLSDRVTWSLFPPYV